MYYSLFIANIKQGVEPQVLPTLVTALTNVRGVLLLHKVTGYIYLHTNAYLIH